MSEWIINGRKIGADHPPFIVAEMSGNHNGSLDRAMMIIKAVADAGADAVKLQTYTADTMTVRCDNPEFLIQDPHSPWHGRTLYELYQEAHTPWEWHETLFSYARQLGLTVFSTPFDKSAVNFLMQLDVPLFKVASFENTDLPLIRTIAATGRPIMISTGTATLQEVATAVHAARDAGASSIMLLKCTSSYPASPSDSNLRSMAELARTFELPVGLSDHTPGIGTAIAAVALGAPVIEKHITLARADGGVDAAFSLEPHELADLVRASRQAWESLGSTVFIPTSSEQASRQFRRSLYVVKSIRAGEKFTPDNVRAIRPGFGMPPDELEHILTYGKAACDLLPGTALAPQHIQKR